MDDIMTLEEVAQYCRVSERTVIDWVQKGDIPGGKLGTSWRFKRSEVDNWINQKLTPRIKQLSQNDINLNAFISKSRTCVLNCETKSEILNHLIDLMKDLPGIQSRQELSDAVFQREKLMSTGIGLSIAIPHARLNGLNDMYMAFCVNTKGIKDYDSLDGLPVRIVVMILAGREQHARYITALSLVAKMLKDPGIRENFLSIKSNDELLSLLMQETENL